MLWFYNCLCCDTGVYVQWNLRDREYFCRRCNVIHRPVHMMTQKSAFVSSHSWPNLMEHYAYSLKGYKCTVPGCSRLAQTLDHRVPYSKGGRTSLENLFPMCYAHNQSKSDKNYEQWLSEQNGQSLVSFLAQVLYPDTTKTLDKYPPFL